jgi:hypothetical protein
MIVMSKMNDVDVVRRAEVVSEMAGRHANMPGKNGGKTIWRKIWREEGRARGYVCLSTVTHSLLVGSVHKLKSATFLFQVCQSINEVSCLFCPSGCVDVKGDSLSS